MIYVYEHILTRLRSLKCREVGLLGAPLDACMEHRHDISHMGIKRIKRFLELNKNKLNTPRNCAF